MTAPAPIGMETQVGGQLIMPRVSQLGATPQVGQPTTGWDPSSMSASPYAEMASMASAPSGQASPQPASSPWGGVSGAALTPYGPDNDLRGTSVLPSDSERTQAASGQADNAYNAYSNYELPQWNSTGPYQSGNSMDGIQPVSTSPVAGPDYGASRNALGGAGATAEQLGQQALLGLGGIGSAPSVTFNGQAASAGFGDAAAATGGAFAYDPTTGQARGMTLDRLSQMSAPDRQALALQTLEALEAQSLPAYEQAQRQVGQKAAALGRIGSGVTTNELGDLALQREKALGQQRSLLSAEAAAAQLQDQIDYTNVANNVFGSFAGADQQAKSLDLQRASILNQAAQGQLGVAEGAMNASSENARNALTGQGLQLDKASLIRGLGQDAWGRGIDTAGLERDYAQGTYNANVDNENRKLGVDQFNTGLAQDKVKFNEDRDRYGYESGVNERNAGWQAGLDQGTFLGQQAASAGARENQMRGIDLSNREELRGERDFQNSMARQAQQDQIAMQQFYEWLNSQNIDNATQLYGSGQTGNPGAVYGQQAGYYGDLAQDYNGQAGDAAALLPYIYNRNRVTSPASSSPAVRWIDDYAIA